jgi:hypothetical protein
LDAKLGKLRIADRTFLVLDGGTDEGALLRVADTALPQKRLRLAGVLGKQRKAVVRLLGKPETAVASMDVFKPWAPDERCGVVVTYGPGGRVESVEASCDDGINPSERRGEILRWLGIPDRAEVQGYKLDVSKVGVTLQR